MSRQNVTYTYNCEGLFLILFVVFLVLKLAGLINWSWWLVCLPLYFGLVICLGAIALVAIVAGITFASLKLRRLFSK